ncbi:hypothetical protein [Pusillimonas minor]|uniref:Uncharacterized protein n=1 Tax=Pusillimonas minor TaxID=2697024 RepID=A0A842HNU9_9BURK|nr:hypothetical protein [Pusillimonas minor]MBC2769977.1 hypothetical protein [Pusillimonas minor]
MKGAYFSALPAGKRRLSVTGKRPGRGYLTLKIENKIWPNCAPWNSRHGTIKDSSVISKNLTYRQAKH